MNNYWEDRYKLKGNSGLGSYGIIGDEKANFINNFIIKNEIKTISDFGCGDGNQISLLTSYELYHGYDISNYIISECRNKFKDNNNMMFYNNISDLPNSDLCMSLDVIYHIIDIESYESYLNNLFNKSNKYVIIFSSNHERNDVNTTHIYHRIFTEWINNNILDFTLIEESNNFPNTSAKFFVYKKI